MESCHKYSQVILKKRGESINLVDSFNAPSRQQHAPPGEEEKILDLSVTHAPSVLFTPRQFNPTTTFCFLLKSVENFPLPHQLKSHSPS